MKAWSNWTGLLITVLDSAPPGANDEYNICLKLVVLVSNTLAQAARAGFRPVWEIAQYGTYT